MHFLTRGLIEAKFFRRGSSRIKFHTKRQNEVPFFRKGTHGWNSLGDVCWGVSH